MGGASTTEEGTNGTYRSWRFRPRPRVSTLDDERRFHTGIRAALRIAAGLGCRFTVRMDSGARGGLSVEADNPASVGWFRQVLSPIYAIGGWSLGERPAQFDPPAPRRFGRMVGPSVLPLPFAVDRPPWADTVLLGLSTCSGSVTMRWALEPGPVPQHWNAPGREEPPPTTGPEFRRPIPSAALERLARDRIVERRYALAWATRVTLLAPDSVSEAEVDRVAQVVGAGTRLEAGNGLRFVRPIRGLRRRASEVLLSEPELIGLFPSPWAKAAEGPNDRSPGILLLGRSPTGAPIRIPCEPEQGRHLMILGETGMGKSSLLVRLLNSASRLGSVILLDPVGDTGRRWLGQLEPEAARRTTWISPMESPIGINALDGLSPGRTGLEGARIRSSGELVSALHRVRSQRFAEGGFWGPRIEEVLGRALDVAAGVPNGTLLEAHALLSDEELPGELPTGTRASIAALRAFSRERPEEVAGSRRVLGEIANQPVLRRMLCERGARFHLREAGAPGAITVVTGDAPAVGESAARYLMAVHLALLWSELLGRSRPTKVFLALEEAQWYAHEGLAELLRLGRRGNIHVWTTTQSLRSVGEGLREALLTNTADLVLFRGDPEEAREFARWSRELSVDQLMALPRGHASVMLGKGNSVEWVATLPLPPETDGAARRSKIRESSWERYLARCDPGDLRTAGDHESGPPERTDGPPGGSDGSVTVLGLLAAARAVELGAGPLRVSLPRLRELSGCTELELRTAGSLLKQAGILLRRELHPEGAVWELGSEGWSSLNGRAPTPEERERARALVKVTHGSPGAPRPTDKDN